MDSSQWDDYVVFRDVLRADAALREEYAALKAQLRDRFAADRKAYTSGKHEFIERVIGSAEDR